MSRLPEQTVWKEISERGLAAKTWKHLRDNLRNVKCL
jgi:hypothetical protein